MAQIWNSQEYKLSDKEQKAWATNHKDNYVSAVDVAKRSGIKIDGRTVGVNTNIDEVRDIEIMSTAYAVMPAVKYARKNHQINGKFKDVYMLKGRSPKDKNAVFFTLDDFNNAEDIKKLKDDIMKEFERFKDAREVELKTELSKNLSPLAKRAVKELPPLVSQDNPEQAVHDWFRKNGFTFTLEPKHFKDFVSELKKTGHVEAEFGVSAHADRWGHQTGSSAKIDFKHKTISLYGWSSDD